MGASEAALRAKTADDERRLERYERRMALPIFLAAVLPILFSLAGRESIVSNTVLIVAPWFLIPGLGDARFLALARLARLARVLKAGGGSFKRLAAQLGRVGIVTGALIITCGYVTYSAERSVNPEFGSFGDAMWWATVTITTVGYGDITPITTAGRITAVVLMFSGLALLGVLAGALASFFGFAQQTASADASAEPMVDDVDGRATDMRLCLADLRTRIAALDSAVAEMEDPST